MWRPTSPFARRHALFAALLLAFGAQFLFTGEVFTRNHDTDPRGWGSRERAACVLLLGAVALAACGWSRRERGWNLAPVVAEAAPVAADGGNAGAVSPPPAAAQASRPPRPRWPLPWAWTLGAACAAYAGALCLYAAAGENRAVRLLWLSGMVALPAAAWLRPRTAAAAAAAKRPPAFPPLGRGAGAAEWLAVAAITAGGFLLRSWRLPELPAHMDDDVSLMGWFSLDLVRQGNGNWFGMSGSGHLLSTNQILAWSMRIFGDDLLGLVMSSVLAGTLTLPLVYLLGRELFGRRAGFVATALLAGSYAHIHFSRILFGPQATLLLTAALLGVIRGRRTGRELPFALGGVTLGLSLLTYDSARVGPVVIAALALGSFAWRPWRARDAGIAPWPAATLRQWAFFGAGALAAFGPMLAFVLRDFELFVGRGNTVMLWTPITWAHSLGKYGATNPWEVIWQQIGRTALALHYFGDESPHFALGRPMVSATAAALGTLGAGLCLRRWRDVRCAMLLAWVGFTFLLGGVLTSDPPYWPHLNIALPAIMLLAGLAADRLGLAALARVSRPRAGRWAYAAALAVVLAWSSAHSWRVYRDFASRYAGPRVRSARYLQGLPAGSRVFLVDRVIDWNVYSFRFLNRQLNGASLKPAQFLAGSGPEVVKTAATATDRPTVLVVYAGNDAVLPAVRERFPRAVEKAHRDQIGDVAFRTFEMNLPRPAPGTAAADRRDPRFPVLERLWAALGGERKPGRHRVEVARNQVEAP